MEDLLMWARVVVRISKIKISRRRLADYVKKIVLRCVLHVQHDYIS